VLDCIINAEKKHFIYLYITYKHTKREGFFLVPEAALFFGKEAHTHTHTHHFPHGDVACFKMNIFFSEMIYQNNRAAFRSW